MKLAVFLAPAACLVIASCSESDVSPISSPDSGHDADVTPPGAIDGGTDAPTDVTVPDAGPPKRLAVQCTSPPCYLAVSGNGGGHFCGLLDDGTVRCWGRDTLETDETDGALGRGRAVSVLEGATPAPVVGLSDVTQISVGPSHGTCALTSGGAVYCWGRNEFGQLGRSPVESRLPIPTRVEGIPPASEVALGHRTGCAIGTADRAVYCWGASMDGLGIDAEGGPTFGPQLAVGFRAPVHALTVGTWISGDTIIGLLDNGILATLGTAPAGDTSLTKPPTRPWELPGALRIGAFAYAAADGRLVHWRPKFDLVGQRSVAYESLRVPDSARTVEAKIFASGSRDEPEIQGGALLASGRLFRWGLNASGTLGVDPTSMASSVYPIEISQIGNQVVSFATTRRSTCASLVSGKIRCWGSNTFGELGRGAVDIAPHHEAEEIR